MVRQIEILSYEHYGEVVTTLYDLGYIYPSNMLPIFLDANFIAFGNTRMLNLTEKHPSATMTTLEELKDMLHEQNYEHLIGKEVEVRKYPDGIWMTRPLLGVLKSKDGSNHFFVQSEALDSVIIDCTQIREIQKIHIEKGDYTEEELMLKIKQWKENKSK